MANDKMSDDDGSKHKHPDVFHPDLESTLIHKTVYTPDEKEWIKTHFHRYEYFMASCGLSPWIDEDRQEAKLIVHRMMKVPFSAETPKPVKHDQQSSSSSMFWLQRLLISRMQLSWEEILRHGGSHAIAPEHHAFQLALQAYGKLRRSGANDSEMFWEEKLRCAQIEVGLDEALTGIDELFGSKVEITWGEMLLHGKHARRVLVPLLRRFSCCGELDSRLEGIYDIGGRT